MVFGKHCRVFLVAALGLMCGVATGAPKYRLVDLGNLPGGGETTHAHSINDSNQIVGASDAARGYVAFIWQSGFLVDLGGISYSPGYGINEFAVVAGTDAPAIVFRGSAYRWNGVFTALSCPSGFPQSESRAINKQGTIAGTCMPDTGPFRAAVWSPSGTVTLLAHAPGFVGSEAWSINDAGIVVGRGPFVTPTCSIGCSRAFVHSAGVMTELPNLSDATAGHATAISNRGLIVGINTGGASGTQAVAWEGGVLRALGDLPGGLGDSVAYGVNEAGLIVGHGNAGSSLAARSAVLWEPAGIVDLNRRISGDDPLRPFVRLTEAVDINNLGYIIARGKDRRDSLPYTHSYLLVPLG